VSVDRHKPPYKVAGAVFLVLVAIAASFVFLQFRGDLMRKTHLTVLSPRAGLVVDPGSKVTYNGVEIGKVAGVDYVDIGGAAKARLTLNVEPRYVAFIPRNVVADVRATTVFGNKYISFSSPKDPSPQRITSHDVIDAASVTTEFNTVFETVMSLSEQVDPIELNATLTATAQAVAGLGERFGDSLRNANQIMADLDPRMPQIHADTGALADLADVYANASLDLWDGLDNATTTAQTLNDQRGNIDAASVTTEFNTVFETVMSLSEQVDPIELNATLTATAQAVTGLGERFGDSLLNANRIMDDLNPRMPQLRADTQAVADLADVYADASTDLWDGLDHAAITARTLNDQRGNIDAALLAAIGFGKTAADSLERAGPYFVRAAEDLLPTTTLLDDYRGMIFCTIRNYAEVAPRLSKVLGGDNGYALKSYGTIALPGDPFIYPDNLPRVNAHGGPEGRPGCWQKVTKYLYPFPYLVMDTGYSIAPYNHLEFASPLVSEYLWGRQIGESTINP